MDRICGCLYVHFETILDYTRNEQMWCLEAFRGNANCAKHLRYITSHVGTPKNVSGENMTRLAEVKKMSKKRSKLKVIIHAFRLSRYSSSERHGMPPKGMGGHWKGVIWLGTNMWMPLRLFQGNFAFHDKWTNEVFRGFWSKCKLCQAPTLC